MSEQPCLAQDHGAHHAHHAHHTPLDATTTSDSADTYESANKQYFDAEAHKHNNRAHGHSKIGQAMLDTGLFKPGITTVMDFACGTGLISRALATEDPKSIVGVDISQGMVDQYNKTVDDHGIPPEEMRAICATVPDEKLDGMSFDVIVCACAYHHLPSIDDTTQTLVSTYLNLGGSLLVADILHGASTHELFADKYDHIVPHKGGFAEQDIRSTFERAGLKNITFDVIAKTTHHGHRVDLFLARGDK